MQPFPFDDISCLSCFLHSPHYKTPAGWYERHDLLGLPCVWAVVSRRDLAWGLTVVLFAASLLLLDFVPDIHPHPDLVKDPIGRLGMFFPVTFGIMLTAGFLGIFLRTAWRNRNWKAFGILSAGYLLVALVALLYAMVVLFAE